jgi:hypothetical protein
LPVAPQDCKEFFDSRGGNLTRNLSGGMTAHTIGHKEGFMLDVYDTGVLVGIPDLSLIAPRSEFNMQSITSTDYLTSMARVKISYIITPLFVTADSNLL